MASRRHWQFAALSAVTAILLAACGGSGSEQTLSIGKVVSFGDSLSDLGTYTPATSLATPPAGPYFGGKFTTNTYTGYTAASNTSTANLWIEWVASRVGVAITPAEVGIFGQSQKCPAAANPALAGSCTGYGQGGARVTDPNGIGKPLALTVPMVTQVANHLAKFGGFASNDLVFVWGGNNDAFIQLGTVAAGAITPAAAVANMQTAATDLANLVKTQILAKGATRVAVLTLPDASTTPGYSGYPSATKALLSQLSGEFNNTLVTALSGSNARIIDMRTPIADFAANPAKYGFTNATSQACDKTKISAITAGQVTSGSSLFCNATAGAAFNGLTAGASASTWAFADDVHPTTGGHKVLADIVVQKLKDFAWIPNNL